MEGKRLNMLLAALLGLAVIAVGAWVFATITLSKPAWGIFLTNYLFFTSVTQGILALAIILRITSAKWSANFFRLATKVTMSFFPVALAMLVVIFVARDSMFYWVAEADHSLWYNSVFFIARNLIPFLGLYVVAGILSRVGGPVDLDTADGGSPETGNVQNRLVVFGYIYLLLFVIEQTIMSWDLGMILDRHFADTAYSPLFISGSILAGVAGIVLLMGLTKLLFNTVSFNEDHFKNMGQLLLGLGIFWVYVWYVQFFNVYFVNLPEETGPLYLRIFGGYGAIYVGSIFLASGVPFILLIWSKIRNSVAGVTFASASVLLGIWMNRYLMVVPSLVVEEKTASMSIFNPANVIFTAGVFGIFLFLLLNAIKSGDSVIYTDERELEKEVLIAEPMGWQ